MIALFVIVLVIGQSLAQTHPWDPQPRDANWLKTHQALINQTLQHGKDEQIVFIGDSITAGWGGNGKTVWTKYYTPRHAYNYGIGGDRTEHVLYRIANKEFDGLKPKAAVLMIGTNNLGGNTIEDIAHGVQEILKQLHIKMSTTKILMLGVLPRAEPLGTKAKQLNVLLKKLADEKTVFWLDMWSSFEDSNGTQHTDLYVADHLHLNTAGYEVWEKTMAPLLDKLAGPTVESHPWIPEPRDANWLKRHEQLVNQTLQHKNDEQIVFVGDSITEGWAGNGKTVWNKYYTSRHAYNYGIGGDRTEHVLYRIENKEFDGPKPKATTLMIGTNNLGANTIEDIAHGVQEILKQLLIKMPSTKVILLGVLPRTGTAGTKAKQLNVLLKKLADEKTVFWLDMWSSFVDSEDKQLTELFLTDHVHLTTAGYEVWHKTMDPLLNKLDPNY